MEVGIAVRKGVAGRDLEDRQLRVLPRDGVEASGVWLDSVALELRGRCERCEEVAVAEPNVEVPPPPRRKPAPRIRIATQRVAGERVTDGTPACVVKCSDDPLGVWLGRGGALHQEATLDLTVRPYSSREIGDVPYRGDAAISLLVPEKLHVVVVAHFAPASGARDNDRHLALSLDDAHGVSRVSDYNVCTSNALQEVLRSKKGCVRARRTDGRCPRLDEDVVLGMQRARGRYEAIERPAAHPDRHQHLHQ
jgi:hypothetical protein